MCDTLYVAANRTRSRYAIFGKNSDRQRNEAQGVSVVPRSNHASGTMLKCTYLELPQVCQTHAALLCRPFWGWGAEMGANEHGLVIGNEGLHSRGRPPEEAALTGMDLVRLALERTATARDAVRLITELLETYGQGGNCGHLTEAYYHNGFLIADPKEAFVLETVDREWMAEPAQAVRTMSNIYSVGSGALQVSRGMRELLGAFGCDAGGRPDYARLITHPNREHIGQAGARRLRSAQLLEEGGQPLTVAEVRAVLRDHGSPSHSGRSWHPADSPHISLCMHAGAGERAGQTVGSMISDIRDEGSIHWVTATSAPCLSIFKPVLLHLGVPEHGPVPSDRFDPNTLWWRHEVLHRTALERDLPNFLEEIGPERDALEAEFDRDIDAVQRGGGDNDKRHIIDQCWRRASEMEARWWHRLQRSARVGPSAYQESWLQMNERAGFVKLHA